MSNDHLRNTHTFLNEATDGTVWSPEQQPTVATLAVAEATLALAYEQRTANLIAYLASANREKVAYPVPLEVQKSIQGQIDVRLGLA